MRGLAILISIFALILGEGNSLAAPQINIAAELGPEWDSNATRLQQTGEGEGPISSGLLRLTADARLRYAFLNRHLLSLGYQGGVKWFWNSAASVANEMVHHGEAGWSIRLPSGILGIDGSYYDAIQQESLRDFRTETGSVQFVTNPIASRLTPAFLLGYRGLQYKPDDQYDFHSVQGGVAFAWKLNSGQGYMAKDWLLHLAYTAALRFYQGLVLALPSRCLHLLEVCTENSKRQDFNHQIRTEIHYLGDADASLWYLAEVNQSNSYGEALVRHALGLKFTTSLVWNIFFSAKLAIQLSRFRDPYLFSQLSSQSFLSIDDENRSNLIVQLARDILPGLSINLRYSLYVNESSSSTSTGAIQSQQSDVETNSVNSPEYGWFAMRFLRQTIFLGIRVEYER